MFSLILTSLGMQQTLDEALVETKVEVERREMSLENSTHFRTYVRLF